MKGAVVAATCPYDGVKGVNLHLRLAQHTRYIDFKGKSFPFCRQNQAEDGGALKKAFPESSEVSKELQAIFEEVSRHSVFASHSYACIKQATLSS